MGSPMTPYHPISRHLAMSVRETEPPSTWPMLDNLKRSFSNIDSKTVTAAISIAVAISSGGMILYYFARNRRTEAERPGDLTIGKIQHVSRTNDRRKIISTSRSNKNVPEGMLVLHQCPRGRRTPCIAPYPLKLETFLRVYNIKYKVELNDNQPRAKDAPWITLDLEDICDSHLCVNFLNERYELHLLEDLTEQEKATVRAFTHLLENHLYWGIGLWRWVYDGARSLTQIQSLPPSTMRMVPQVCKTVEQSAFFHGIGKKAPNDVIKEMLSDLNALSEYLGKNEFFVRNTPSEFDCTAFAMLSQMLWNMDGSPYEKALKDKYRNLVEFCWRMRTRFWPDWDHCLDNKVSEENCNVESYDCRTGIH